MNLRIFVCVALSLSADQQLTAQAPPFSYRGVYEATLANGAKAVFFVSKDAQGFFGYIRSSNQQITSASFSVTSGGGTTFNTTLGIVGANFTATGVSGTIAGQSFSANRTVLNSVNGSLQGGYEGTLWFQSTGSLGYASVVLTPGGAFYALGNTTSGLQAAIGTWSQNGTFTGTAFPGNFAMAGTGVLNDGVFNGRYDVSVGETVLFNLTKENVSHRMSNLSTRGYVSTGERQMIGGFVIRNGAKRVLIRALGPSLGAFGISEPLGDPSIALFSGSTPIATNDNWQAGNDVAAINATGFAPTNAKESALLVTLEEGAFTVIVSGVGGATGVAIVEAYEID